MSRDTPISKSAISKKARSPLRVERERYHSGIDSSRENESTKRKEEEEEEKENVLSCLQFASDPVSADRKWSLASERVCTRCVFPLWWVSERACGRRLGLVLLTQKEGWTNNEDVKPRSWIASGSFGEFSRTKRASLKRPNHWISRVIIISWKHWKYTVMQMSMQLSMQLYICIYPEMQVDRSTFHLQQACPTQIGIIE